MTQTNISSRHVYKPNCLRRERPGEELNPNFQYQRHEIIMKGDGAECRKCGWQLTEIDLEVLLDKQRPSQVIKMKDVYLGRIKTNGTQRKVMSLAIMWGDVCSYCGTCLDDGNRTLDHYIPRSKGGENALGNLRLCCFDCNKAKADLDGPTWEAALIARLCPRCLKSVVYGREVDSCCTYKWNQPKLKL